MGQPLEYGKRKYVKKSRKFLICTREPASYGGFVTHRRNGVETGANGTPASNDAEETGMSEPTTTPRRDDNNGPEGPGSGICPAAIDTRPHETGHIWGVRLRQGSLPPFQSILCAFLSRCKRESHKLFSKIQGFWVTSQFWQLFTLRIRGLLWAAKTLDCAYAQKQGFA